MKTIIFIALILTSSLALATCPDVDNSRLNTDQIAVKNLLISAYKHQSGEAEGSDLSDYTQLLKSKFTYASNSLNTTEVASLLVGQDKENNICPDSTYVSSETLMTLISSKIFDTYYGCGCEE